MTLSRAQMAVQRFELAVAGYQRALALSPGLEGAAVELGEARVAAAQHAAHERAVSAAAAQAVAAARQHALRHGLAGAGAGGAENGHVGAHRDGAAGGSPARGVVRPRGGAGDGARPREHRRGLWGGALDAEAEAEEGADAPPPRLARTAA